VLIFPSTRVGRHPWKADTYLEMHAIGYLLPSIRLFTIIAAAECCDYFAIFHYYCGGPLRSRYADSEEVWLEHWRGDSAVLKYFEGDVAGEWGLRKQFSAHDPQVVNFG